VHVFGASFVSVEVVLVFLLRWLQYASICCCSFVSVVV
jgi:hypothetical protein